jgi:CTP:molybdopterin cytidylyltransferase MocA
VSVAGIILAAGESTRMGSPKALLLLRGETFADLLIETFSRYCDPVILVLGHDADLLRSGIRRKSSARLVINHEYQTGQISSLQCGLRAAPSGTSGVVFTLVDHPNVRPETMQALLAAGAPIAIPRFEGRRGHPVFIAGELFPEFLKLPAGASARDVLDRHPAEVRYIDVNDPGILQDVDDPEAYRRIASGA